MAVRKTASTAKGTATAAVKTVAAKAEGKKAYVFFNCDGEKSQASMNLEYNNDVYQDTKKARKELWEKILGEKDKVQLNDADLAAAEKEVLEGDPAKVTKYLPYGSVVAVSIH